ncbi:hypothetical protein [Actomonas aquatica]|uniref:VWFA domain-containing protein n=1 Tax=Actomonas aquatica TaxID=2866162 RepID=A0ABZ1C9G8_9BACT|nr:hypothetical protein [Opitutus sp. WL0086]WRQ88285.1 hypothetical protein K1X11_002635 [Opitutus sp. WL0086]
MLRPLTGLLTGLLFASPALAADVAHADFDSTAAAARLAPIFAPPATTTAVLSPDGRKVAFDLRQGAQISIIVFDLDAPQGLLGNVVIAQDPPQRTREDARCEVLLLSWASPERIVAATITPTLSRPHVAVFSFDADGSNATDPRALDTDGGLSMPIGPIAGPTPQVVVIPSRRTRARTTSFKSGDPSAPRRTMGPSELQVLDLNTGATRSVDAADPEFATLLASLSATRDQQHGDLDADAAFLRRTLPGVQFDLLSTAPGSSRRVARLKRADRPARFLAFDRATGQLWDLTGDPARPAGAPPAFQLFELENQGETFRGFVSLPAGERLADLPVIYLPWKIGYKMRHQEFEPLIAAFNTMGYAVVAVEPSDWENQSAGMHLTMSERRLMPLLDPPPAPEQADFTADRELMRLRLNPPLEQVQRELDHVLRALELVSAQHGLSRTKVALFADGQCDRQSLLLYTHAPTRFKALVLCGVNLGSGPEEMGEWSQLIEKDAAHIKTRAFFAYPDSRPRIVSYVGRVTAKLKAVGVDCEEAPTDFEGVNPMASTHYAATLAQVEAFLQASLNP